ncbi:hypothetical protein AA464_08510 [Salmonella enterica subsp. enterica serovar Newport]|nr:hypothetical protein [Salmonella enterica subsp. enterica serovar Newport]
MNKITRSHVLFMLDVIVILFSSFVLWIFTQSLLFSDSSPFIGYKVSDLFVSDLFTMLIFTAIVLFVYHFIFINFVNSVSSALSFVINKRRNRYKEGI